MNICREEWIPDRIRQLKATLCRKNDVLEPELLASMQEELFWLSHILDLWMEFGDIAMDVETECLEESWHSFPAGTHREEAWRWFENCFQISVAKNLMGN